MRAGRLLRSRVQILQDSSNDGDEAPVYSGAAFASDVRCEIESVSGNESYRGMQLEAGINYAVTMRYLAGVSPSMRVQVLAGTFSGLILDVRYVQQVNYRRGRLPETVLFCSDVPVA